MKASERKIKDLFSEPNTFFSIPVYQRDYNWQEKQCKQLFKDILTAGENKEITKEDKELINSVVDAYSNYSATDLVKLTHEQAPWKDTYVKYRNRIITIDSMRKYFNA